MPGSFKILDQELFCDRNFKLKLSLYNQDGQAVAIGASDILYAKLAQNEGAAPSIDVGSDAPITGGSNVTIITRGDVSAPDPDDWIPCSFYVEFTAANSKPIPDGWASTTLKKTYVLDVMLKDVGDANKLKPCGRGNVQVHRSPSGLAT